MILSCVFCSLLVKSVDSPDVAKRQQLTLHCELLFYQGHSPSLIRSSASAGCFAAEKVVFGVMWFVAWRRKSGVRYLLLFFRRFSYMPSRKRSWIYATAPLLFGCRCRSSWMPETARLTLTNRRSNLCMCPLLRLVMSARLASRSWTKVGMQPTPTIVGVGLPLLLRVV